MIKVIVVSERLTEQVFVRELLAPALWYREIDVQARLIRTSPTARGGSLSRDRVLDYLRRTLHEKPFAYVTTFFDLYGLESDFPGVSSAVRIPDPLARATRVETELTTETVALAGCRPERFFPHIQPYEFEALLFADISRLPEISSEWTAFVEMLEGVRKEVQSPEYINDGKETHPSAHLQKLHPRYEKVLNGVTLAKRIGLDRIREECAHFAKWLGRIEELTPLRTET